VVLNFWVVGSSVLRVGMWVFLANGWSMPLDKKYSVEPSLKDTPEMRAPP